MPDASPFQGGQQRDAVPMQGDNAKPTSLVWGSCGTMCRVADPPRSSQGSSLVPLERGTDLCKYVLECPLNIHVCEVRSVIDRCIEILKDDDEEYVRRSVANNLNDISKDHPGIAIETAARWWTDDPNSRRLVRHGLRTLIKSGEPGALAVLGYSPHSPVRIETLLIEPAEVSIGESVRFTIQLENPSNDAAGVLADFVVHFVKANGTRTPKVFKGAELLIPAGDTARVSKLVSLAQHSTRTHYPGIHRVEIQINGVIRGSGEFAVRQL